MRRHKEKGIFSTCLGVGLLLLFSTSAGLAGDAEPVAPRHAFQIGLGASHYDYREDSVNVGIDGVMYGIMGSYTYHDKAMVHVSLEHSRGDLNYDGAYVEYRASSEDATPDTTDAVDWKVDCRFLIGYDCVVRGNHMVTPFVGIGYRYLNDHLEGSVLDELVVEGSEREVEYLYSPIGFMTCSPLSDNWTWGVSAEYDLFWGGKVKGRYAFHMPELDQDSGYGLRFSLRFKRTFSNRYALSLEPYVRYWDIDKSDTGIFVLPESYGEGSTLFGYFEPKNETTSYGLQISLEF